MTQKMIYSRFVPENSQEITDKDLPGAAVYLFEHNGKPAAIGYSSPNDFTAFILTFKNRADQEEYANKFLANEKKYRPLKLA